MKPFKAIAVALLLLPTLAAAQKKPKKSIVSALFAHARYVYVEATDGNEFQPRLYTEDRQAIADVQNALNGWKRYVLTTRRDEADLVFVVRKGRLAGGDVGFTQPLPPGRQSPPGQPQAGGGWNTGAETGPPDDFLEVCQINPDGTLSTPIWIRTMPDGLEAPNLPLFQELKTAVDSAYPLTQVSQSKKP